MTTQISLENRARLERIKELTTIPSPTGYTYDIMDHIQAQLTAQNIAHDLTPKGGLLITMPGRDTARHRFVTAHVDTLGGIVRAIKPDGRLKMDRIGGFTYHSIDGNYVTIHSSLTNEKFQGTVLLKQTSVHVYSDSATAERNQDNMEIRLDHIANSKENVEALGIRVGDFISFDPRTEIYETGYIKSRHLDDKVSVAILLEMIEKVASKEIELAHTTHFYISNNEEIGYGGNSNIDPKVEEYLAVDMGAMGTDQQTDEHSVSICVKDASGPYHLGLRNQFVELCEAQEIPYQLDIYPHYGSDASAAMKAGADVRHGLCGAGIDASHAYERTHIDSVNATFDLVEAYLTASMD